MLLLRRALKRTAHAGENQLKLIEKLKADLRPTPQPSSLGFHLSSRAMNRTAMAPRCWGYSTRAGSFWNSRRTIAPEARSGVEGRLGVLVGGGFSRLPSCVATNLFGAQSSRYRVGARGAPLHHWHTLAW